MTPTNSASTGQIQITDPTQFNSSGTTYMTAYGIQVALSTNTSNNTAVASFTANGVSYTVDAAAASNGTDANVNVLASNGQGVSGVIYNGATWRGLANSRITEAVAYTPRMISDVSGTETIAAAGTLQILTDAAWVAVDTLLFSLSLDTLNPFAIFAAGMTLLGAADQLYVDLEM